MASTVSAVPTVSNREKLQSLFSLVMPWLFTMSVSMFFLSLDEATIHSLQSYFDFGDESHRELAFGGHHKPLWPLGVTDIVGFLLAIIGLIIASGGGIGGGGILVPIYIIIMRFSAKHAIALSNVSIFGGAVANTTLNSLKRHPFADRPLVDWDLILVMEPMTIIGALVGAIFNKILPEAVVVICLVIVLSAVAWKTLSKGIRLYRKETQAINESQHLKALADEKGEDFVFDDGRYKESDGLWKNYGSIDELEHKEELEALLEKERYTPLRNIQILAVMFVSVIVINTLKGGGAFKSPLGIICGSVWFWLTNVLMLAIGLFVMLWARQYLMSIWRLKKSIGYVFVEGDVEWDPRATLIYPAICSFAGVFAGMFGIGGGIVKGPLMLAMSVHPEVASATSACMILFTAFTATTSFIVYGLLIYDYAAVMVVIGFAATYVGQVGLTWAMKKNGRYSFIVFSIGAVVGLSALLMGGQFLMTVGGDAFRASGLCHVGKS